MTSKLKSLKRLAKLYNTVEQIRSLQLLAASTSVAEVVRASREEAEIRRIQGVQSRVALVVGDSEALALTVLQDGLSGLRQERLEEMRVSREMMREQAQVTHQASREQKEQMGKMVERTSERETMDEQRRIQAASDDRYASRLAWRKGAAG